MKKTTRYRILSLLLVFLLTASVTSCSNDNGNSTDSTNSSANTSNGDSAGSNSTKDTLIVAISADRGTLDPRNLVATGMQTIINPLVYETLFWLDPDGNMHYVLGESVEQTDGLTIRVKVKEGIKFENGSDFTASDVLYSCYLWNNRLGEAPHVRYFNYEKSSVISEYECELVYDDYLFTIVNTLASVSIFDEQSYDQDTVSTKTNGTGPYVVSEYVPNSHMSLTLREGYWGETPAIKNIECKIIAESAQMTNAVQTGTVDVAAISVQDVSFVETLDDYNIFSIVANNANTLYYNVTENSIFYDNVDARMAVAYAINREAIANIALGGYGIVPNLPAPNGYLDEEERFLNIGPYAGRNIELAKEYAEKGGIVGKKITLICDTSQIFVTIAELIQQNLEEIGVEMEIWSVDQASWLATFFDPWQSPYDMGLDPILNHAAYLLAGSFFQTHIYLINSMYGTETAWPGHDRMMELVGQVQQINELEDRREMVNEMIQIQTSAMTYFALAQQTNFTAYNKDLKNFDNAIQRGGNIFYRLLSW